MAGLPAGDVEASVPCKCKKCGRGLGFNEKCTDCMTSALDEIAAHEKIAKEEALDCPSTNDRPAEVVPCPCCPDGEQLARLIAQNMCAKFDWAEKIAPAMADSIRKSMVEYQNHGNRNTW